MTTLFLFNFCFYVVWLRFELFSTIFHADHFSEITFRNVFFLTCYLSFWTSGKELSATIENLRPATDYHVRSAFWFKHAVLFSYEISKILDYRNERLLSTFAPAGSRPYITVYKETLLSLQVLQL